MQDQKLIIRAGYAYTKYDHPGPTVTQVSAAANFTHAAYDSGWIQIKDTNRIPFRGMALEINIPGDSTRTYPYVPSGTSGTAALAFTVTFSDDGTNAVTGSSIVASTLTYTAATGPKATLTSIGYLDLTNTANWPATLDRPTIFWLRIPRNTHKYIKVTAATTLGTITTMDYGPLGIALVQEGDSEAKNCFQLN